MDSAVLAWKISRSSQEPDGSWKGSCPVPSHGKGEGDRSPSFTWRDGDRKIMFKQCWAGCSRAEILAALRLTEDNMWLDGTTLEQVARELALPVEFLQSLGCEQAGRYVKVPYRNRDSSLARRYQLRHSRRAKTRFTWDTAGKGTGELLPYGLWKLDEFISDSSPDADPYLWPYLFLVEGASDCWSAWLHDEPALGLPGATQANLLLPEYFKDILHVYLAREPGKAGDTFVDGITKRLRAIGYTGEIWDAPMPGGLKDVNEVLQKFPERDAFKDQMLGARTMATLIETEPAPLVLVAEPVTDDGRPMKPYELTAFGNRDRLIDLYGEDMAYAVGMGWMHWDGTRWKRDPERHLVGRRAEIVVKQIKADAMRIGEQGERDGDLRKTKVAGAMLKWYHRCAARAAVSEMLDLAEKKLLRDHETFDAKPMLFNVANGTIDLSTGVFREHRKSDHLTFLCPVAYDPAATCPRWELFINEVMQGDAEMVDYMQRGCGYFLTGDTSEQAFFIFWGLGSNGKSTFLEVMRMLLGYDYAKTTPASTFLKKADNNSSAASPEIARLKGARLVTAVETERAQRLATGLVKQQTGDDRTAARHLFQEMMEFQTQYKVILAVNNKPEIQDQSKGMWRRVHLVPWEATFEPRTPGFNPKLKRDLLEELPGILNWAIAGAKRWYEERLEPPTKVRAAVEEYRQEQDELGEFIAGKCVLDRRYDTPIDRLYDLAKAEIPGLRSKKALTQMMDERGIKRDFRRVPEALSNPYMGTDANALETKSARCYLGIGVVEDVARVERIKKVRAEAEARLNRGRS